MSTPTASGRATSSERTAWDRLRGPDLDKLKAACELTILFNSAGPWDNEQIDHWDHLLGIVYAPEDPPCLEGTTRVLCDAQRRALES